MAESPGISEVPTRKPRPKSTNRTMDPYHSYPTLTILAHPHPARIGERVMLHELSQGQPILLSRRSPSFSPPGGTIATPLNDPYLSRSPVLLQPTGNQTYILDQAQSATTVIFNGEPLRGPRQFSWADLHKGIRLQLSERMLLLLHLCSPNLKPAVNDLGLIGQSDAILEVREEILRIRDLDTPILLRGPSGTGKELAARAIHNLGSGNRPFICVNMSAIPPSLAAAELFGAAKGSFTGSSRNQAGFFRAAHGGTLFLDEIGETPLEVQAMLLRALETGEIQAIGSQSLQKVQVRLIAATDADLEVKIAKQDFRAPLFHRLSGYVIHLPSLKQRPDDLGRLFIHFAKEELATMHSLHLLHDPGPDAEPWLPPGIMDQLLGYDWPGNVRQLRNVVRQLIIGSRDFPQLQLTGNIREMLQPDLSTQHHHHHKKLLKPRQIPAATLVEKLRQHQWDIKATASSLGISRGSLYALIEKTPGLRKASDLSANDILAVLHQYPNDIGAAADHMRVSQRALRRRMFEINLPTESP